MRIVTAMALCLSLSHLHGLEIAGADFPGELVAAGQPLRLFGGGPLHYRIFWTAYAAALYLPPSTPAERVGDDVAKRIEFNYFYAIEGTGFADATTKTIGDNIDAEAKARIQPAVQQLNALYRDVKPGDRYALTYVPGIGTELALNGVALGTVPGAEFARALFLIWLGPKPLDADFKTALTTRLLPLSKP